MTDHDQLRAAFEKWYDSQPNGKLSPWDVWQAAQVAAIASGHACVWALDNSGNLYRRYREPSCHAAALAGAQPVAWRRKGREGWWVYYETAMKGSEPLYSAPPAQPPGEVVVSWDEAGRIVAVTRQDEDGRILSVIAQAGRPPAQGDHSPDAGRASPTCKESLPVDAGGVRDTSTIGCEHGTIGGNCPFCRDVPVVCECGSVPAYGEAHHHACTSPTQQEGGA